MHNTSRQSFTLVGEKNLRWTNGITKNKWRTKALIRSDLPSFCTLCSRAAATEHSAAWDMWPVGSWVLQNLSLRSMPNQSKMVCNLHKSLQRKKPTNQLLTQSFKHYASIGRFTFHVESSTFETPYISLQSEHITCERDFIWWEVWYITQFWCFHRLALLIKHTVAFTV